MNCGPLGRASIIPQSILRQAQSLFYNGVHLSASSFNVQYHFFSGSCLRLLPRNATTSTLPSIFRSITCFRRQFLVRIPLSYFTQDAPFPHDFM
jgi:hypothetical protein